MLRKFYIDALDVYFPSRCISESDLEKFDGVPAGKVRSPLFFRWADDN
jgi:hypothetical protein